MPDWIEENGELFIWISVGSVVFFFASIIMVGVVIVRMPEGYFAKEKRERYRMKGAKGVALRIAGNILGWALIMAGVAMLVLPGQGLLVLLIGIMLAEFPGKFRLERWIVSRGKVLKTINWLRKKFGKPALRVKKAGDEPGGDPKGE